MQIRRVSLVLGCSFFALVKVASGDAADSACSMLTEEMPLRVGVPFSAQYDVDTAHWATGNEEPSRCSVRPASPAEVATIFKIINTTRTPWAVKGGGHAYNRGYSSTSGVQIALSDFNSVRYDPSTSTAHIGAGLIWDDVYAQLVPLGVNVVGGRVPGVGVAGFILGGGYGWLTQQYGLTIDTVVSFDLVTPAGDILVVTEQSNPDLFFGLRGGGNNFGIVTGFTLRTFPQGQVYGGPLIYIGDLSAVTDAVIDFDANNKDPKAAMLVSYSAAVHTVEAVVFLFYDGPTPPDGIFDKFTSLPYLGGVTTRSYTNFISSLALAPKPQFMAAHTIPIIQYTRPIVEQIINQTELLGAPLFAPLFATLSIESFTRNVYDTSKGGAYPHNSAHPWTPFQILISWVLPRPDDTFPEEVLSSADTIHQVAIAEGQSSADAILYNNYARQGTPLELLYGENLPRLRALRAQYDPNNLLSLTGGWKF